MPIRARRTVTLIALCMLAFPVFRVCARLKINCWEFDRGNVRVVPNPAIYGDYRDIYPGLMLAGDETPSRIEFDFEAMTTATNRLRVRYASPQPRPTEIWLDDKLLGEFCGKETRNSPPYFDRDTPVELPPRTWHLNGAEWDEVGTFEMTEGRHTLTFKREGLPVNLIQIRIEGGGARKWPRREVALERIPVLYRTAFMPTGAVNVPAFRMALEDMTAEFGPAYPHGTEYLKRLADLEARQKAAGSGSPEELAGVEAALRSLRREAMLAHPSLDFDKLLFVKRFTYGASIYRTHGASSSGGNICLLSPVAPDGKVTELVPELSGGLFSRYSLSYDAKTIVFGYRRPGAHFRIYEVDVDPETGLRASDEVRQLTSGKGEEFTVARYGYGYDDMDPCYLPNGKIMFVSTRAERCVLCAPGSATTLHLMDADGGNIRCVSTNPINELAPTMLDDGRMAYTRWEYVDKGFGNVQTLWTMRPDGSYPDHLYKNDVTLPAGMMHACSIPGSRLIATIGAPHHGESAGPVILVDSRRHRRTADAMINITPEMRYPGMYHITRNKGYFKEPYAFSEKLFIIGHTPDTDPGSPKGYAIYVLDKWGNRAEVYRDPDISSFQPMPFGVRRMPVVVPPVVRTDRASKKRPAVMFMQDVYQGLTGVERGRVKYLRVMEAVGVTWYEAWRGEGTKVGPDVHRKRVHGIVPVHEDGSAFFYVPPEKNIFFQALDEDFMELQRMRTSVNLMPGESRSCVGCHELRRKTPLSGRGRPMAMGHPVRALTPQPGDTGARWVDYPTDIQPILDRHCLKCHSGEKPKADLTLAGGDSCGSLMSKRVISFLGGGKGSSNVPVEAPLTFGSHRSKLVKMLREGHPSAATRQQDKVKLSREEFIRVVTWIDANVPRSGKHVHKGGKKWKGEPDFQPLMAAAE